MRATKRTTRGPARPRLGATHKIRRRPSAHPPRDIVRGELEVMFDARLRGIRYQDVRPTILKRHNGEEGHFVEHTFGMKPNSRVTADYKGFEIKIVSPKTSILDKIADEYLFSQNGAPTLAKINGPRHLYIDKNHFIRTFGMPNTAKGERFAWSGRATPTYNAWNRCGQTLAVCPISNNFYVVYSYHQDRRTFARDCVPDVFKEGYIAIATWYAGVMRERIDGKWNVHGFCMPVKSPSGVYQRLAFGRPFGFEHFVRSFKQGAIRFDSGLVENSAKSRSCSKFRGNTAFISELFE